MFFRKRFNGIAEILDARYRASSYADQNPADKGELCEIVLQEALGGLISGRFVAHRGGKVVDSTGAESKQCDIVVTSRSSLPAFENKGLYPIEATYAVIHVTSTLSPEKLQSSLDAVASIPKSNAKFAYLLDWDNVKADHAVVFRERLPYQVVFAFQGTLTDANFANLNDRAGQNAAAKQALPHLIVVNRAVMVEKVLSENAQAIGGEPIPNHFAKAALDQNPGTFLTIMASELGKLASWDNFVMPEYEHYFNADLEKSGKH